MFLYELGGNPNKKNTRNETKNTKIANGVILCSALAGPREGYKCVPHDNCNSQLGKRTDGVDSYSNDTLVCEDSSQTCCHKDHLIDKVDETSKTQSPNQILVENQENHDNEITLCSIHARVSVRTSTGR